LKTPGISGIGKIHVTGLHIRPLTFGLQLLSIHPSEADQVFPRARRTQGGRSVSVGFFQWRCDRRRGKGGRRCLGIKSKSSLEAFWKWWHLIYKAEMGHGLDLMALIKINDVRILRNELVNMEESDVYDR
jgi:hypothetical protein